MNRDYILCVPIYVDNRATRLLAEGFVDSLGREALSRLLVVVNYVDPNQSADLTRFLDEKRVQYTHLDKGSVAKAWNYGIDMALSCKKILFATGSDNIITDDCLEKYKNLCNLHRYDFFGHGNKRGEMGFSFWGGHYLAFEKMKLLELYHSIEEFPGRIDENFYPAYYEDLDFHKRIKRCGINTQLIDEDIGKAVSGTLRLMDKENSDFIKTVCVERNKAYHFAKWGTDE